MAIAAGGGFHNLGLKAHHADLNPFVAALVNHDGYMSAYPNCLYENADCEGNGYVDFDDINPFGACLVAGTCP